MLIVPLTDDQFKSVLNLASCLRNSGILVDIFLVSTKIKKKFKYANKIGIQQVIMIGADEVSRGIFTLQNMISGEKRELTLDKFLQLTD